MFSKKTYEAGMILSITGLYFFSFFQRVAVPGPIFNDIQTEFAISASGVTALSAIYLFVYATMQPFAGYLADRFGGIRVVLLSGILLCLGSILFPLSGGVWGLYLSRALVGVGASTMYLCLVKETDHYFGGKNFAMIFGLLCLLGYAGGLVGTRPFRMLVENIGWRNSCMTVAIATCCVLLVTWLMKYKVNRKDEIRKTNHIFDSMAIVLKNKLNYPLLITIPLCFSIYFSLQATIGQKFLEDFCGITTMESANYTFVMMLFTMSGMFISGFISRLIGNKRKCFIVFNAVATILAMLLILSGISLKLSAAFFFIPYILSAAAAGCTPVNATFMKEINPPGNVAISIGIFNSVVYIMVAVVSKLIGQVLDIFKSSAIITAKSTIYPPSAYITLFSIMLAISLIALVASLYCRETNGNNIYPVQL
jgi:cyanate permease